MICSSRLRDLNNSPKKKPNTLDVAAQNAMEAIEILKQRELNK